MRRKSCFRPVGAVIAIATLIASPAQAAFHLWQIREIYTDASGTLQFIELFCPFGGQQFVSGQQIRVSNVAGSQVNTFTLSGNLSSDTTGHAMLLATAAADAAGAPTPDYVLPQNFLFSGGGTITFFGANSGSYTVLPTDGVQSRNWGDGNSPNSPQNFAGQVGTVVPVPEPATWALIGLGSVGLCCLLRRRSA
ncbi:MAG TPA: PEP-CTERM sorting domain-containing protein [Verrucomicrobiae bacterium]|nr:PEP-CTERM sorting domain-containing protein [Verrucomicrobiae bacterium]